MQRQLRTLAIILLILYSASFANTKPNLLLITIDTLRADHLSCYGYGERTSPEIDRLASNGLVFKNAYSPVPLTLPAHATILSGLYPNLHGKRDNAFFSNTAVPSIAGRLRALGYQTAAFVSGAPLATVYGLSSGFQRYDDDFSGAERSAMETADRAVEWITNARKPYFAWVHFFDPHAPYEPPADFKTKFRSHYAGEIASVDRQVGRLAALAGTDTVIVITADHGEGLGEHGETTHGVFLYNSTLRIPLILTGPGVPRGVRTNNVSLCDIAPTIYELAGLSLKERMDGVSLLTSEVDRTIHLESLYASRNFGYASLFGVIAQNKKYVHAPIPEFYDLSRDPGEKQNLSGAVNLDSYLSLVRDYDNSESPRKIEIDEEQQEKLRSLGYAAATAKPTSIDPKEKIAIIEKLNDGIEQLYRERFSGAETTLREITVIDPENSLAYRFLGDALSAMEKFKEAAEAYSASLRLHDDPDVLCRLAKATNRAGNEAGAVEILRTALKRFPSYKQARFELASYFVSKKEWDAALELLQETDPDSANQRGILYLQKGDSSEALKHFLAAVKAEKADYWNNLAIAYEKTAELEKADQAYRRAIELRSSSIESRANLAFLLLRRQKWEEAEKHLRAVAAKNPQMWTVRFALGVALENQNRTAEALTVYEALLKDAPASWPQRSRVEARVKSLN